MGKLLRVGMAVSLVAVTGVLGSCQTTNLAARSNKNECSQMSLNRKDCQDSVGCYWDYQKDGCVAAH